MIVAHDLAVYLFSAMNTFTPMKDHNYYEPQSVTQARYEQFAEDVASVSLDPRIKPLFSGDEGRIKTALLLVVMASFESSYRNDVMSCKKVGDRGVSFGPWQSQRSPDTVCQGNIQAAWVAIEMIHESFQVCHGTDISYRLAEYTDGNAWDTPRAFKRSSDRMDTAIHYYSTHKPKVKASN